MSASREAPTASDKGVGIAKPTIAEVLAGFLAEQQQRLAPKTFTDYRGVVELLQHFLDSEGYLSLGKADEKRFWRLYNAKGDEHREFCEIFGPEHILPHIGGFLDWFIPRKVVAGKDFLRTAGTVTKRLGAWLAAKGHAEAEDAEEAMEDGARAARNLPKAAELASLLHRFVEDQEREDADQGMEDHFTLSRVERGRIWLRGMGRPEVGPIAVPEEISARCRAGWSISGVVGKVRGRWRLVEVWNVYPSGA